MSLANLFWCALVLLWQLVALLAAVIGIACWPMWGLWVLSVGFRAMLSDVPRVANAVAFPLAWFLVLGLELVFLDRLLPGWGESGGEVFLATLAITHLAICTPWVAVDYARS